MRHHFLLGFLALALQPFLLHFQARPAVVAAAQFHDVLAEAAQRAEFAAEFFRHLAIPAGQGGGVTRPNHRGQSWRGDYQRDGTNPKSPRQLPRQQGAPQMVQPLYEDSEKASEARIRPKQTR